MGLPQYKPSDRLNVYDPTTVLTQVNKCLKAVKKGLRDKNSLDNPSYSTITTIDYLKFSNNMFLFRRRCGLSSEAIDLLIYCYLVFKDNGEGVNSMRVCKDYNNAANSELQSVRSKLNNLEAKGYLVKLGKTVFGSYLYIPSVKTIEDIENIFK